jgi:carbamoyltransferase
MIFIKNYLIAKAVMYILGISCFYHDSAACLLKDGRIVAAAQEERFNRKKNCSDFPSYSIDYCLREAGITVKDISGIAFNEKPFLKFQRVITGHISSFPFSLKNFLRTMPHWLDQRLILPALVKKELGYEGETYFIRHHLAHAASSFFASGYDDACIVTADAVGEWESVTVSQGRGSDIEPGERLFYPDSPGIFYSALTTFLGFKADSDEGKVMALADYGTPSLIREFKELISLYPDGSFALNPYFISPNKGNRMYNKKRMEALLGAERQPQEDLERRHFDIASTLQAIMEDVVVGIVRRAHNKFGGSSLCLAGGVFLNCVANHKILKHTPFQNIFIQPAAGDSGGALGAALYVDSLLGEKRSGHRMRHAFWGPSFSNERIKREIFFNKLKSAEYDDDELAGIIAGKIWKGEVVALFKGRMEWGPRALGARSILASPSHPQMKDILNKKVKHREWFRPFGIAVLEEDCREYFDLGYSPFMLFADKVHSDKKNSIPSGLHINDTSRIQTVNRKDNPFLYKVIVRFKELSGIPAVINTSFNDRGEPIVCSPSDAIACFRNTDIDYLVMENNILEKTG